MIDILKLCDKVNKNKKEIAIVEVPKQMTNIVYLLNGESIVYITKTQNVELWLIQNSKKYFSTHYFSEMIFSDIADDELATIIMALQPLYNKALPQNSTKYISKEVALKRYRIYKREFDKICKEVPYLMFNDAPYLEKQVLDDLLGGIKRYEVNMPKINQRIVPFSRTQYQELVEESFCNTTFDLVKDENVTEEIVKREWIKKTDLEIQSDWQKIEDNIYIVTGYINENTFEARHEKFGKKMITVDEFQLGWSKAETYAQCNYRYEWKKRLFNTVNKD